MWKTCPRWTSSSGKFRFIVIPVDGLTLYLSRTCDNLCSRTIKLLNCNISPFCDVAQTSDCGVSFVSYFKYKPFMWCRSDVRLWHALPLFSVISPLCGVAPTPDCGITILQFPLEESFRPSFGTQYVLPLCLNALVNLFIRFMFTFVISYVRTVLRVLS